MSDFPTTQIHLLMQVRDRCDQRAWIEFVELYRPAIYRFARRRGLQEADAQDLAQTVLCTVADKIADWEPDAGRARFRTWLSRVAQNQAISILRQRRVDCPQGGSGVIDLLAGQPDPHDDSAELRTQYRREVFRRAARQVRQQVEETSWQAFWMTAVERASVADAAKSLGMSLGAVYTARSRIIRRLQVAVQRCQEQDDSLVVVSSGAGEGMEPIELAKVRGESE